jgi:hypothetical protein
MRRLPKLLTATCATAIALLGLPGCGNEQPAERKAEQPASSNRYLEAVQEAEALRHSIEERNLQQQQVDQLLRDER